MLRASTERSLEYNDRPISVRLFLVALSFTVTVFGQGNSKDEVFNKEVDFSRETYQVRDVWAKKSKGTTKKAFKATIPA